MTATATEPRPARADGLSTAEAERRLAEFGPNRIEEAKGPSPARQLAATASEDVVHTSDLSGREWLVLLLWPPLVLGAEELGKAVVPRRRA